ncbi:MAG: 2Fe-2S iron-sulfur cluster-binding protein [Steroidobacteraceae bacterium]
MPKITFMDFQGAEHIIEVDCGSDLRSAALTNSVPGIEGACGGFGLCATCHVYVDNRWQAQLPLLSDEEDAMLVGTASPRLPESRLACQIRVHDGCDGMIVRIPELQGT